MSSEAEDSVTVTDLVMQTHDDDYGLSIEITIQRLPANVLVPCRPRVSDLPADVRDGLRAWLDGEA